MQSSDRNFLISVSHSTHMDSSSAIFSQLTQPYIQSQGIYYGGEQPDHFSEDPLFNAMDHQIEGLLSMGNSEHFQDIYGQLGVTQNDFLGL